MRLTYVRHSTRSLAAPSTSAGILTVLGLTGLMTFTFAMDRMTGLPHVQHLYYLPIIFAAARFGMLGGTGAAAVAILLYHLANPHMLSWRYEESDVLQIIVFVAVGGVAAKLAEDARRFHHLAMTDDLTGLHNLRSFETKLRTMVVAARTARTPLSLLVLDVDQLKSLNDKHGHLTGAEAVRTVGRIIADHMPGDAIAYRYGGDEFVIAVPRCSSLTARRLADDLRRAVEASAPVLAGLHFPERTLSISVGVACRSFDKAMEPTESARTDDDESESLFRTADGALYAAKNGGRNRVHLA